MTNRVISRVKKGIYPDHFGLANQLFQIATVFAYAKRNGLVAAFPDLKNTERNGPYLDTIFRNIETGHSDMVSRCLNEGRVYYEPTFIYTEIPDGMRDFLVDGYFQSEKYFSDCSDDIQKLFLPGPHLLYHQIKIIMNLDLQAEVLNHLRYSLAHRIPSI